LLTVKAPAVWHVGGTGAKRLAPAALEAWNDPGVDDDRPPGRIVREAGFRVLPGWSGRGRTGPGRSAGTGRVQCCGGCRSRPTPFLLPGCGRMRPASWRRSRPHSAC